MVFSGWENDLAALTSFTATAHFPVLKNPDGSDITGPGYEYIVTGGSSFGLTYPAASLSQDPAAATLTHRVHLDDAPVVVPPAGWAYNADGTAIHLVNGMGQTMLFAAQRKDIPMLTAGAIVIGIVYMLATLLADLTIAWMNPMIRLDSEH